MTRSNLLKTILIAAFFNLTSSACKNKDKVFFDYNTIDYYRIDFVGDMLVEADENKPYSLLDSLKKGVLLGNIPKGLSDTSFIGKVEQMGYRKMKLDPAKYPAIDKIFMEKEVRDLEMTACLHFYRDILVFRKNKTITGITKICFDCMAKQIQGSRFNTQSFGQEEDYKKLENLLRN